MTQPPINPRLRLLTLDLDDTLWPLEPVIRAAESALLDWLADHAPRLAETHDRASLRELRRRLIAERPEIAHDIGLVRRVSLAEALAGLGPRPEDALAIAESAMAVFLAHRNRVEPYTDSGPALRRLAARFRLVSVTNGNADPELTPLRGVFAHRVTAAEAGASKPHPAVFERALGLAGCTPGECLHVGDEPYLDIEAARAIGIEAVWVNRCGRPWPAELAPPLLAVTDLNQLADWLLAPAAPVPALSAADSGVMPQ
jgi:putative hydrolase of the HAD superfamily